MSRARATPQRPAFYARISQDRTGRSVGVEDQIRVGQRHLAGLGWPEPIIYSDNDISAQSGRTRPGFERLLADIESGAVDGLSARHLDRLLRRVTDLERILNVLDKRPLPVALVEGSEIDLSTIAGRLLARILASVAANESEMKGDRVGAARRREALAGKAHGHLGYGYDAEQHIVATEADVIREVATRLIEGQSLRSIAVDLNNRGEPTPGAGRWDARRVAKVVDKDERPAVVELIQTARSDDAVPPETLAQLLVAAGAGTQWTDARVRDQAWSEAFEAPGHAVDDKTLARVLSEAGVPADATLWRAANLRAMIRRGALCGWREFSPGKRGGSGDLVAEGSWTPILDKYTTEQIRRLTERPGVRGRTPKHLLAGILRCGLCGSPMAGSPTGRGSTRYACSKQPGLPVKCGGLTVTGPPVDAMVSRAVVDTLADAKVRAGTRRKANTPVEIANAEVELGRVAELREQYAVAAAREELTTTEWRTFRDILNERQKAAERVLGAWAPSTRLVLRDVPVDRFEIQTWWESQPIARRREVIGVLIESIPVAPAAGTTRFDPARVGDPVWKV